MGKAERRRIIIFSVHSCLCVIHIVLLSMFYLDIRLLILRHHRKCYLTCKFFNCRFEEGGQTALGPALLVSVAMACQVPGSKVIICTDGMANVGLGSHEQTDNDDNAYDVASVFYTQVGQMAVDKG